MITSVLGHKTGLAEKILPPFLERDAIPDLKGPGFGQGRGETSHFLHCDVPPEILHGAARDPDQPSPTLDGVVVSREIAGRVAAQMQPTHHRLRPQIV
jgi:hypothetical protein